MKRIFIILTAFIFSFFAVLIVMWEPMPVVAENAKDAVWETAVSSADVCTGENLLTNPSFEGEYDVYVMDAPGHPDCQTWNDDEPSQYCERVKTADGWHPWWRDTPRSENWMNIQPEYVPSLPHEQPPRVLSGEKSQHYFSFWSTHEAGMYQQVAAVENGRYCFSINGHAWSSRRTKPSYKSDLDDHGSLYQKVGIDPTGGKDWQSSNIIWSEERLQYDEFGVFAVEAVAESSQITVFFYSRPDVPVKHNDVYWDDAVLSLEEAMTVQTSSISFMVDVDEPQIFTRTIQIDVTPTIGWTAVLDASSITSSLNNTSGSSSGTTTLTIDTTSLTVGTYKTQATISPVNSSTLSPTIIPITLYVVPEVHSNFLPYVNR